MVVQDMRDAAPAPTVYGREPPTGDQRDEVRGLCSSMRSVGSSSPSRFSFVPQPPQKAWLAATGRPHCWQT